MKIYKYMDKDALLYEREDKRIKTLSASKDRNSRNIYF